jgi:hypothetical protein
MKLLHEYFPLSQLPHQRDDFSPQHEELLALEE